MHEEAWVGNGSDPSLIHVGKRLLELLIHKNNDNTDETSIVGNLLFCCLNVFHVLNRTKHFQWFCISKRIAGIVVIRIDGGMLPMLINPC